MIRKNRHGFRPLGYGKRLPKASQPLGRKGPSPGTHTALPVRRWSSPPGRFQTFKAECRQRRTPQPGIKARSDLDDRRNPVSTDRMESCPRGSPRRATTPYAPRYLGNNDCWADMLAPVPKHPSITVHSDHLHSHVTASKLIADSSISKSEDVSLNRRVCKAQRNISVGC